MAIMIYSASILYACVACVRAYKPYRYTYSRTDVCTYSSYIFFFLTFRFVFYIISSFSVVPLLQAVIEFAFKKSPHDLLKPRFTFISTDNNYGPRLQSSYRCVYTVHDCIKANKYVCESACRSSIQVYTQYYITKVWFRRSICAQEIYILNVIL